MLGFLTRSKTGIAALPTFITLKSGRSLNLAWKVAVSPQIGCNIHLIPPITKRDYWSLNLVDHTHHRCPSIGAVRIKLTNMLLIFADNLGQAGIPFWTCCWQCLGA
jgi:hypothetical protein